MSTANATEVGTSANVSAVVRMLLAARGEKYDVLVAPLGLGRTTAFEKVSGRRKWTADEVQDLAYFFDMPVTMFYEGTAALLRKAANVQGYQPSLDAMMFGDLTQESSTETPAFAAA